MLKTWVKKAALYISHRENPDPYGLEDGRLWAEELREHAYGQFSMAVVQANLRGEDRSHVEAGRHATFVGVYDGHGGTDTSEYVARHLFDHLQRLALERRGISEDVIDRAIADTERGYRGPGDIPRQEGLGTGSCCLVGVIWNRRLYIGNLGDSRAVLGFLRNNKIFARQVTEDHNANLQSIRNELRARHMQHPNIVVQDKGRWRWQRGKWRVGGILQVTRAIGDFQLKYGMPGNRPYVRNDPQLHNVELNENCRFVIFASDGLWECLSNQDAVDIVCRNPREGIARRLAVAAMEKAGRKRAQTYADLKDKNPGERRNFHDDITVVVVYIDRLDPLHHLNFNQIRVRGNQSDPIPSNFHFL